MTDQLIPFTNPRVATGVPYKPGVVFKAMQPRRAQRPFGLTAPRLPPLEPVPHSAQQIYDPKIAYLTTVVSAWAYSDAQTMANQLAYYGLPNCTVREFQVVNGAMLIVAAAYFVRSECGRIGILVFRGTVPDDFINWLTDANTSLRNFHFGRVHAGFFQNIEPLWGDIAEAVDDARSTNGQRANDHDGSLSPLENLYITGHSLGAAMAVIAAARIFSTDYASWWPLVRGVYTYGQPMVGDVDFGRHYNKQFSLYRHVYRTDVVPHLPPRDVGEFAHFGQEFFAATPADGWQDTDPPRVKQCMFVAAAALIAFGDFFSRRLYLLRWLRLPYSLEDHGPQGYIDTARASLG
jgi:hypothetical protein